MEFFAEKFNPGARGRFIDVEVLTAIKDGQNVYGSKPHVEIHVDGIADIFIAPVTARHKERFPEAWAAYEASKKAPVVEEVAAEKPVKKAKKASKKAA